MKSILMGTILAAALASSCIAAGPSAAKPVALPEGTWQATALDGRPAAEGLTLEFLGGRVSGFAGCNRFNGSFTSEGGGLRIGPLVTTRKACPPPEMETEKRLLKILDSVRRFELGEDRLQLLDDKGAPLMELRKAPPAPDPAKGRAVSGTLTYLEKMLLPPTAVALVKLVDVSRADAEGVVVGEQRIGPAGQIPIEFSIPYDPGKIDARHTYAVQARIVEGSHLLFVSDSASLVLTGDRPDTLRIVLKRTAPQSPER